MPDFVLFVFALKFNLQSMRRQGIVAYVFAGQLFGVALDAIVSLFQRSLLLMCLGGLQPAPSFVFGLAVLLRPYFLSAILFGSVCTVNCALDFQRRLLRHVCTFHVILWRRLQGRESLFVLADGVPQASVLVARHF